jgi:hypothetical protein
LLRKLTGSSQLTKPFWSTPRNAARVSVMTRRPSAVPRA